MWEAAFSFALRANTFVMSEADFRRIFPIQIDEKTVKCAHPVQVVLR